jgi:hypothetical protein
MIALLLGVALLVSLVVFTWRLQRRRAATEVARIAGLIAQKGLRPRFQGQDESLRLKTNQRREAADRLKRRAASMESGVPAPEVLRRIK